MRQRRSDRAGAGTVTARPAEARVVIARTQRMMATEVSVRLSVEPWRVLEAEAALAACFSWFAEVERRLSRFDPASELCALNRSAGSWFAASETLYAAVFMAIQSAFASDGLFNPGLLRQLEALGYDRDFARLSQRAGAPDAGAVQQTRAEPLDAWKGVIFDSGRQRIHLPQGVALDLGGIAKGWAADVALERHCQPFPGALINVGGDLRLHGGPQLGQPWSIGLRDPRGAGEAQTIPGAALDTSLHAEAWNRATLAFSRGALATSGAVRRWWRKDGARYHHLLDPRTGQPLPLWTSDDVAPTGSATRLLELAMREPLVATVTALAPTGAQAEVATKVALARGQAEALAQVERAWARWGAVGPKEECDAGVALIFTLSDGRIVHSRNLAAWLASWGTAEAPLLMLLNASGAQPLELELPG